MSEPDTILVEVSPGRWKAVPRPRMPSLSRRAANLAVAVGRHARAGMPLVDDAVKARRLALCESCAVYWDAGRRSCRHPSCGCYMDTKAGWAEQQCPIGRWGAET